MALGLKVCCAFQRRNAPLAVRRRFMFAAMAFALVVGGVALATYTYSPSAFAQNAVTVLDSDVDVRRVVLARHKSRTVKLDTPFSAAVVGAPDVADVLPMSDTVFYIQGKKPGTTNVSVFDKDKQLITVIDIEVTVDTKQIVDSIRSSIESRGIHVTTSNGQVILTGMATNAVEAEKAVAIAQAMVPGSTVINAMKVAASQQVMLKVRYLEVNRLAAREIGVNWYGANGAGNRGISTGQGRPTAPPIGDPTPFGLPIFKSLNALASGTTAEPFAVAIAHVLGGSASLDVMINALEKKDLIRSLAEPDLVALSGDKAKFHAGGKIPVPSLQPGTPPLIAVEYKEYGVELEFTPVVLANGIINLKLKPKVSELDYANAVLIEGYRIPALTNRETETTVELRDGQSFAISGLLQNNGVHDVAQLPWLGSLPVLGALFRSTSYQQKETDLVVIITPHLVAPAPPGMELASPLDQRLPANDVDAFLLGKSDVRKKHDEYVNQDGIVRGPYGHMLPNTKR